MDAVRRKARPPGAGAGIIRGEEQCMFPPLPRDPPQLPVTRCRSGRRTRGGWAAQDREWLVPGSP